jgi:hypothetical protein
MQVRLPPLRRVILIFGYFQCVCVVSACACRCPRYMRSDVTYTLVQNTIFYNKEGVAVISYDWNMHKRSDQLTLSTTNKVAVDVPGDGNCALYAILQTAVSLSIYLAIYLSIYLSIYLLIHLSIC